MVKCSSEILYVHLTVLSVISLYAHLCSERFPVHGRCSKISARYRCRWPGTTFRALNTSAVLLLPARLKAIQTDIGLGE